MIVKQSDQLGSSRLWISILQLASGTAVSQVIVLLTTPVLTRFYSPHDFGVAGFFLSFLIFLVPFSSLNYYQAIILPKNEIEALRLGRLCLFISLILFPIFGGAFFSLRPSLKTVFKMPEFIPFFWVFPLAIMIRSIHFILSAYMSRYGAFLLQSKASVCQTLSERILSLALGFAGYTSSLMLVFSRFISLVVETVLLLFAFLRTPKVSHDVTSPAKSTLQLARQYREFPLYSSWAMVLANGSSQLPMILLPILFTPAIGGFFALGNRLCQLPMQLFGDSIRNAYYKEVSDRLNQGLENRSGFETLRNHLVSAGMFPFVFLFFFGDYLFAVIFGKEWSEAGRYVGILGFFFFFQFISSPIVCIFNSYKKQKYLMLISSLLFINNLLSLLLGAYLQSPSFGFIVLTINGIAIYILMNFLAEKALGANHRLQFITYLKYLAYNLPFVLFFHIVKHNTSQLAVVVSAGLVFGAAYYAVLFWDKVCLLLRKEVVL